MWQFSNWKDFMVMTLLPITESFLLKTNKQTTNKKASKQTNNEPEVPIV